MDKNHDSFWASQGYNQDSHIHWRDRGDITTRDMRPQRTAQFERELIGLGMSYDLGDNFDEYK